MAYEKSEGPNPIDVHVGRRVYDRRVALGFNQSELASALGLTFQQVQKYEKGANRISASKLWQIADFLKVDIGYFFPQGDQLVAGGIEPPSRMGLALARSASALPPRKQKLVLDFMMMMAASAASADDDTG